MSNYQNRQDANSPGVTVASRIRGGHWNADAVRSSKELHDEIGCHWTIEQYIFEQGLPRDEEFN
jgi:hypothetical protein